ncbi:MAG: esterase family protein [Chloroflexi bacterium]|nr:esterase family protein [Chloroflexota bacterium]
MKIENDTALFEWRGSSAPFLIGDFNNWEIKRAIRFMRSAHAAKNFWTHTLTLPRDAYMEYAFVQRGRRLRDRLNPQPLTPNGIGAFNNYFYMPDAAPTTLFKRDQSAPRGKVTHHKISAPRLITTPSRLVHLYRPPTSDPCPLIVVFDGEDYLKRAHLPNIIDNLIAQKRIRPVALAMIENGGAENRFIEYACNDATVNLLTHIVLPLARKHLNLLNDEGVHAALGASMGGLISLYTALRLPHIFGKVISQSGGFPLDGDTSAILDLVNFNPKESIKIWMDIGKYDFPYLMGSNPRMRDLLIGKGYDVTYREYGGGHNWPSWRDEVWRGIETIFVS